MRTITVTHTVEDETELCLNGAVAIVAHNGDEWTWSGYASPYGALCDEEEEGGRSPRKADCLRDARLWLRRRLTAENRSTR